MNQNIPDDVPECFDSEDMNGLVRRLADAGWLDGENAVIADDYSLNFSAKGISKMSALGDLLKPYAPECFGPWHNTRKPKDHSKMQLGTISLPPELMFPPLTERQALGFFHLVTVYALKHSGEGGKRF